MAWLLAIVKDKNNNISERMKNIPWSQAYYLVNQGEEMISCREIEVDYEDTSRQSTKIYVTRTDNKFGFVIGDASYRNTVNYLKEVAVIKTLNKSKINLY